MSIQHNWSTVWIINLLKSHGFIAGTELEKRSEIAEVSVCPSTSAMNLRLCFDPIIYKVVYFIIIFKVFKYGAVLLRIEEDYNVLCNKINQQSLALSSWPSRSNF